MTVSQYEHVVPYTDLGGRGYFGVNAALVYQVGAAWTKHILAHKSEERLRKKDCRLYSNIADIYIYIKHVV